MFHEIMEVAGQVRDLTFGAPIWLWGIALIVLLVPLAKRLRPALATTFGNRGKIKSVGWPGWLSTLTLCGAWTCACIGMSKPQLMEVGYSEVYQAREFQILIDDSGSMFSWDVNDPKLAKEVHEWERQVYQKQMDLWKKHPELFPVEPKKPEGRPEWQQGPEALTRFSLARYAAYKFVLSRMEQSDAAVAAGKAKLGDRVGMAPFDDTVHGGAPITGGLKVVLRKIEDLLGQVRSGGTNFDGPNPDSGELRMGAFQYAINQFNNPRLSKPGVKTKVMIFISDGDAGISDQRHAALAQQMKDRKPGEPPIHVFFFVCGGKGQMNNPATNSAKKLLKEVNPPDWNEEDYICWAGHGDAMRKAFDNINRLEQSTIEGESFPRKRDVSREFVIVAMLLGGIWLITGAVFREGF